MACRPPVRAILPALAAVLPVTIPLSCIVLPDIPLSRLADNKSPSARDDPNPEVME
jgi:hypothetical protein